MKLSDFPPEHRARVTEILAAPTAPTFREYMAEVQPTWTFPPHQLLLQDKIDALLRGEFKRLAVFMPPQHGKSSTATVRLGAYLLERHPEKRGIVACYNQTLASEFSYEMRQIVRHRGVPLDQGRQGIMKWHTAAGGGVMFSGGPASGIAGFPANLFMILDDPLPNAQKAASEVERESHWRWVSVDLSQRVHDDTPRVLCQTRWHYDDPAGRLLELAAAGGPKWEVVNITAEAEENDILGRAPGEWLWPAKYSDEHYADQKSMMTAHEWSALYQQRPMASEDVMFPRNMVELVDAYPTTGAIYIRYWDKAGGEKSGDYTAGVLLCRTKDGELIVVDVERFQHEALKRTRIMQSVASQDDVGFRRVTIWIEQEPGSGGKESAQQSIRDLVGHTVHTERATGDKPTRAQPWAAQWQAGNVKLMRGEWNKAFLDEHERFPFGRHDDMVDAAAGACQKLVRRVPAISAVSVPQVNPWAV